MIHVHELDGCTPVPLAHYLKALGILRLVAEQVDPEVRGWWEGERFRLASRLSRNELNVFLGEQYIPTPLVAPWNGGTGFYPKDKKAGKALEGILSSDNPRFSSYQAVIREARRLVGTRSEAPDRHEKAAFLGLCLRNWRGPQREAMAAAVVVEEDGRPGYPALLGTGFNDGRLDFTSNYMNRLLDLFHPKEDAKKTVCKGLLRKTLWGGPARGMSRGGAIGQFLPGGAGGANSSAGPNGDAVTNHWDFTLMLEGAVLFVSHATLRLGTTETGRVAAPFAVSAQGAGYASAADSDESSRGEQWMPLWSQPMTLVELRRLLAEGRARIGARAVQEPLGLARAVARLGVAPGITAFQRYGYIERNGQANLAVPLGRYSVPDQVAPQIACLDDLAAWLPRLRYDSRDTNTRRPPCRLKLAERRLSNALFVVVQHPEVPACWQSVVLALAEVESVLTSGVDHRCGCIPRLRPEWVAAADDGRSPELRLAVSLALQAGGFTRDMVPFKPVRPHWLARKKQGAAMHGRIGIDDAIALVERRMTEAALGGKRFLPLQPARHSAASLSDLAALVTGEVDLDRTLAFARVFMAIDGRRWAADPKPVRKPEKDVRWPDDAWLAIRLAMLPWPLPDGRQICVDPAILRSLAGGDAFSALDLALRRLQAAGIRPALRMGTASPHAARLWAAALAFPIGREMAQRMAHRLDPHC